MENPGDDGQAFGIGPERKNRNPKGGMVLKFSGFLGYPKTEYVLVDLTIGGVHFGEGILTRDVWENLKLLNRPAVSLPDSTIQVMEMGNIEEEIDLVTKARENNPGS
jgi:hypothetical protein